MRDHDDEREHATTGSHRTGSIIVGGRVPADAPVRQLPARRHAVLDADHNALEFLFTPGRVTILGETDGNRLRRIYTDGRPHPDDPDPTFHGHSIGHWEGDTLVVDTVAVLPQSFIALSEALGVPNNGDMRIIEHIHLGGADILHDDLEIAAPHVLTRTWNTTRIFLRQRAHKYHIVEGVCVRGNYVERVNENGDAIFAPMPHQPRGNLVAPR